MLAEDARAAGTQCLTMWLANAHALARSSAVNLV